MFVAIASYSPTREPRAYLAEQQNLQVILAQEEPHIDRASAFVRELRHFHSCIVDGTAWRGMRRSWMWG